MECFHPTEIITTYITETILGPYYSGTAKQSKEGHQT